MMMIADDTWHTLSRSRDENYKVVCETLQMFLLSFAHATREIVV